MALYCQDCRTALKLDGSLSELNPAAFKLLSESSRINLPQAYSTSHHIRPAYSAEQGGKYESVSRQAKSPISKRSVGQTRHVASKTAAKDGPDMSFIMLTDSQVLGPVDQAPQTKPTPSRRKSHHHAGGPRMEDDSISDRMETSARLFEILSARSDIDHPICVECTERLIDQLQKRLANASRERDAYVEFLRQANADVPTEEELRAARMELEDIQEQEKASFEDLMLLEQEKAAMEAEILELEAQSHELDLQEERFWTDRNEFSQRLSALQNERDRLSTQYEHDSKQLERLRRANVFNDTFSIGHDGYFGTINGLRLGRLPERLVDWTEINAAWGHTCLLLAVISEKLGCTLRGYELLPMGSTSRVRVYKQTRSGPGATISAGNTSSLKPTSVAHKLFYNGDALSTLGGLFHTDFDSAMIAFLECLRQVIEHAHKTPLQLADGSMVECLRISYKIERDRIGDHSIKLSGLGNQEVEWSRACKLTLICCKYLLAHASNAVERRSR